MNRTIAHIFSLALIQLLNKQRVLKNEIIDLITFNGGICRIKMYFLESLSGASPMKRFSLNRYNFKSVKIGNKFRNSIRTPNPQKLSRIIFALTL